jgi:hypothetical protein
MEAMAIEIVSLPMKNGGKLWKITGKLWKITIEIVNLPSYKMLDFSIVFCKRLPGRVFDFSQIYIMGMWDFIDLTTGFYPGFCREFL